MTADDNLKTFGRGIQIDFFQVMQHVDADAADARDFGFRNRAGPGAGVIVSANDNNGSNRLQVANHFGVADIAGVKNQLDAVERGRDFRPHETMRVGYYSDPLHLRFVLKPVSTRMQQINIAATSET